MTAGEVDNTAKDRSEKVLSDRRKDTGRGTQTFFHRVLSTKTNMCAIGYYIFLVLLRLFYSACAPLAFVFGPCQHHQLFFCRLIRRHTLGWVKREHPRDRFTDRSRTVRLGQSTSVAHFRLLGSFSFIFPESSSLSAHEQSGLISPPR